MYLYMDNFRKKIDENRLEAALERQPVIAHTDVAVLAVIEGSAIHIQRRHGIEQIPDSQLQRGIPQETCRLAGQPFPRTTCAHRAGVVTDGQIVIDLRVNTIASLISDVSTRRIRSDRI